MFLKDMDTHCRCACHSDSKILQDNLEELQQHQNRSSSQDTLSNLFEQLEADSFHPDMPISVHIIFFVQAIGITLYLLRTASGRAIIAGSAWIQSVIFGPFWTVISLRTLI